MSDWSGRLTLDAFKHDLIETGANASMVLGALFLIGLITYLGRWKWLWKEWITSLDPKRIGVMYLSVAAVMLVKGFIDAIMMRAQQAMAVSPSMGYLGADHFQQIFSAHGTTMIFFVAMGALFGLLNLIVPLQIGARDVAFPFLNAVSFWLFASGALFVLISLLIGKFSIAGWLAYPPLSELEYSPGEGVDYWIWMLQISGAGSLLSGINFLVTILKMRCPGMTFMKMPIFTWSALCSMILVIFAFPILTATLLLLALDRTMGMHFFTSDHGGNPMLYVNLIWAWGHPEVYILILPAFGIFSEVVATFSKKRLFGYHSMVWAIVAITFLAFIVWLHHFFTMGATPTVNAFFGIMTVLIAVPTGVKVFNWLFTMYKGRILFTTPMLWFLGFILIFTIGGMAGVLLSVPPIDFQVHNSLFLVAHFHTVIIGGVLFGLFAAFAYWFPKITGFMLNEKIGRYACWCWIIGVLVAFMPLYFLGFMGATRRLNYYLADTHWHPLFLMAAIGSLIIACGVALQVLQIVVSIRDRNKHRDHTGDPWNGRTLEWTTSSPPAHYNFATLPHITDREPFWEFKRGISSSMQAGKEEDIEMPKNSSLGFFVGVCATIFGFCATWHIVWLGHLGFIAMIVCIIIRTSMPDRMIYHTISKEELAHHA